jgi:hypothetical protein
MIAMAKRMRLAMGVFLLMISNLLNLGVHRNFLRDGQIGTIFKD